jgi:hypothetical protein
VDTNNHAATLTTFENPPEVELQATLYDGNLDPKTYHEAKLSLDWPNWRDTICTESETIHSKQVRTNIPRNTIPTSRRIIGNRLVFTQKDDGRFRARTVAKA